MSVSWSPSPARLCRSCLRRFGDLRKNTPLEFWSMYLVGFVDFCQFQAPPSPVCLCRSCLRRFGDLKQKHAPGFLERVSCGFSQFSSILGSPEWYQHKMTPTTATTTTSQQPACPTATSKQTRRGTKYPVQGIPPHSDNMQTTTPASIQYDAIRCDAVFDERLCSCSAIHCCCLK